MGSASFMKPKGLGVRSYGKIGRCNCLGRDRAASLPYLMAHLAADGVSVVGVRIPPGGKALNVGMAERLLKASWFERIGDPPDKFVVLVDTDGMNPDETLRPYREQLKFRIGPRITAQLQFAFASGILRPGILPTFRACALPRASSG